MFGDVLARIDDTFDVNGGGGGDYLNRFQQQNDIKFEFIKSPSGENRRFSRVNLPGTRYSQSCRKLYFVVGDNWPPSFDSTVSFLTKITEKLFYCSTPKCFFSTPRSDYLARHVKNCTVS